MDTKTQHGHLVLADISGFTSYLAKVELDHAHEILTDLLETIVGRFKAVLTISKLEGDAVFAYAPEAKITRGEMLLELFEATYLDFRARREAAYRRTTCDCKACKAIPTLDLKFFAHHGDYIVQTVSGIKELVGSDVNLIHRLMKNHVTEATGWQAYALFTERGMEHLGTRPDGLHVQPETYEHLGEVQTYCLNLLPRYEALMAARRAFVEPEDAFLVYVQDYPAPPPVVWDWLNDPAKRPQYTMQPGLIFRPVARPGGRTGVGARTHCVHGKDVAMDEIVLDWKPFDYFTVEQAFFGIVERITFHFTPIQEGSGTRLRVTITGRGPVPGFLNRPVFMFMATKVFPYTKVMENMGRRIAEAVAHERAAEASLALEAV
jgi:uncharacterized protein YndB with AHSA1/START domain